MGAEGKSDQKDRDKTKSNLKLLYSFWEIKLLEQDDYYKVDRWKGNVL